MGPQGLSRRSLGEQVPSSEDDATVAGDTSASRREEIVWGKTPGGTGGDPSFNDIEPFDNVLMQFFVFQQHMMS